MLVVRPWSQYLSSSSRPSSSCTLIDPRKVRVEAPVRPASQSSESSLFATAPVVGSRFGPNCPRQMSAAMTVMEVRARSPSLPTGKEEAKLRFPLGFNYLFAPTPTCLFALDRARRVEAKQEPQTLTSFLRELGLSHRAGQLLLLAVHRGFRPLQQPGRTCSPCLFLPYIRYSENLQDSGQLRHKSILRNHLPCKSGGLCLAA
jgi:hypothetical protein